MIKDAAAAGSWFACCSSTAARPSPKPRHRHGLVTTSSSDDVQCCYSTPGKAPRMAVSVSGESLLRAVRYAMAEHGLADAPATVARVMAKLEPARGPWSSPWPTQGQSAQPVRVVAAGALGGLGSPQVKHSGGAARPPAAAQRSDSRDRRQRRPQVQECLGSWDLRGRDEATLTPPERHPNTIMHLLKDIPPGASDAPGV